MPLGQAAQAVQHSGAPDAYQPHEPEALQLAAHVAGVADPGDLGAGPPGAECGLGSLPPVIVGPGGWVQPVHAPIVSPYGMRGGKLHAGVDLGAHRYDPIHAASSGIVVTSKCDQSTGNCDVDGSSQTPGCGWYVDIRHAGNVVTRYCHMVQQPAVVVGQAVTAGQPIGLVGTSGNSSGPHLHFEVHLNVPAGGRADHSNCIDPVPFMIQVGVPLGS
jgi:murein DD-endopeptidase MepM/ murein hydrolase activator NlpD